MLNRWCKELVEQAPTIFERNEMCSEDQQRIAEFSNASEYEMNWNEQKQEHYDKKKEAP
jgi:hypothetical protein